MSRRSFRERLYRSARGLDRSLLPLLGPAQLGAGRPEEPYRPPLDPRCPICGGPMGMHVTVRSGDPSRPTYLTCPPRDEWTESATV